MRSRRSLWGILVVLAVALILLLPGRPPTPVEELPEPEEPPVVAVDFDTVLAPDILEEPGTQPSRMLVYRKDAAQQVEVAGSWDGWQSRIAMERVDGLWMLEVADLPWPSGRHAYRFIVDGEWESDALRTLFVTAEGTLMRPPAIIAAVRQTEPLRIDITFHEDVPDHEGLEVRLKPTRAVDRAEWVEPGRHLQVHLQEKPLFHERYSVELIPADGPRMRYPLDAGPAIDRLTSDRPLGTQIDAEQEHTVFRLFAPRAERVVWCQYESPYYQAQNEGQPPPEPIAFATMTRGDDGVWETVREDVLTGAYYSYRIYPGSVEGGGDASRYRQTADPYARAVARVGGNSVVIDPEAFAGWEEERAVVPKAQSSVFYEVNLGQFTAHPSSQVPEMLRGTFSGLAATLGQGTGIDHLASLGVDLIELQPVAEALLTGEEPVEDFAPAYPFAPAAFYASEPLRGSGYHEMQQMVAAVHQEGFGLIVATSLDRTQRESGFAVVDPLYYLHVAPPDRVADIGSARVLLRTSAPMVRRLMTDTVERWMNELRIDGIRLIGGERIDPLTLSAVTSAARRANPHAILMADTAAAGGEVGRGSVKAGWLLRNIDWREKALAYALATGSGRPVEEAWRGDLSAWVHSMDGWGMPGLSRSLPATVERDLFQPEGEIGARSRMAATLLLTMPGIVLMAEGQEFLSEGGRVQADRLLGREAAVPLNWMERRNPAAQSVMRYYRDVITLRRSREGESFRPGGAVTPEMVRWIPLEQPGTLGYFIDGVSHGVGTDWCILLNTADRPVFIDVPFPPGDWILVADGTRVDTEGLALRYDLSRAGTRQVLVPRWGAYIFKRR